LRIYGIGPLGVAGIAHRIRRVSPSEENILHADGMTLCSATSVCLCGVKTPKRRTGLTPHEPEVTLMPMSMTKRLQIPVSEQECSLFQAAARRSRLPLAEWARPQLREKADEALGGGAALGPREALEVLKSLNAPVGPVETMVEESVAGRYS